MRGFRFHIPSPTGNFGDDALSTATRRLFEQIGIREWTGFPLRDHVTRQVIEQANRHDVIVLGGGGLFLRDTNPNQVSGWQWKCPIELLEEIRKPLVVCAVGYNRFRGQEPFDDLFRRHVRRLLEVAAFVSVRNSGSRRALTGEGLDVSRVRVCPCPSLFLRPGSENILCDRQRLSTGKGVRRLAVQLAGDRLAMRLADADKFFAGLAQALARLEEAGYEVHFVDHNWRAESNLASFRGKYGRGQVHDISHIWGSADLDAALHLYRSFDAVIAMRGHGQMVSFGQGVPVISLITHDKLAWFLEDAGMPETSLDANEADLAGCLTEKVRWLVETDWWTKHWPVAMESLQGRVRESFREIAGTL